MVKGSKAFYDTSILIAYLFKESSRFDVAKQVLKEHLVKAISIISIHEIHMYSVKYGVEDRFISIKRLLSKLFKVVPITQEVCIRASHIRRKYRLPEIDALILASAVTEGYRHFFTFDKDFEALNNKVIEKTTIHYLRT